MRIYCSSTRTRSVHTWWQDLTSRTAFRYYHRPSNAPKPTLDIQHIVRNPGLYEQNCLDRNYKNHARHSWTILDHRREQARSQHEALSIRRGIKEVQQNISQVQQASRPRPGEGASSPGVDMEHDRLKRDTLVSEAAVLRGKLDAYEAQDVKRGMEVHELAIALPNLSSLHSPTGSTAEVMEVHPPSTELSKKVKSHADIGTELDVLDFVGAATTSGWGWYYLKNDAALLEQALVQLAISELRQRGWQIVSPPSIVYSHIAAACGFQPRDQHDEQQIYQILQAGKDQGKPTLSLAATAEIPLAGMQANRTIDHSALPLKTAAVSRCYRAEAGARGVDTKGLYRVHEFTKVEMFAWTMPDISSDGEDNFGGSMAETLPSDDLLKEMIDIQKTLLGKLGLSYRLLEMPTADLGASATRKQDIEVYFPSRKSRDEGYGEVTSASICSDYQTRRLNTRLRQRDARLSWPHTVNGTALAVPRIVAAILETHWDDETRIVTIPEALRPWMCGVQDIAKTRE